MYTNQLPIEYVHASLGHTTLLWYIFCLLLLKKQKYLGIMQSFSTKLYLFAIFLIYGVAIVFSDIVALFTMSVIKFKTWYIITYWG